MSIVEFKTKVNARKRITIPSRVNIEEGDEVLVKIELIKRKEGATA